MPATLLRRSADVLAAGLLLAHAATSLAITGGVSVEELLAGTEGTEQQAAMAGAVSAVTVPLFIQNASGKSTGLCTATIVHPRVVLTAAHCVMDGREVSRHMTVLFERGTTRRQALDAAVHPEFFKLVQSRSYRPESESLSSFIKRAQPSSMSNDLALVLLHRQVPETYDVVDPVPAGYRDGRGARKVIAGYGRIDGYQSLNKLSLYFAELQGNVRLDDGDFAGRDEIVLESRYRNGARVNVCQGDSGGPLFVIERGASRLRQIAVASAGDTHCREVALFAPINGQRAMLRRMFDALMQGEQGADQNPF